LRESVKEAVLGPVLADTGWFDPGYLRRLVQEHQSGLRDHSTPLWTLLMFESFLRTVMEARAGDEVSAAVCA
jgi:asparagine synthase (glutamine-hydrolysing)